jgi:hypothetical protein
MSAPHPTEPIPTGIANGRLGSHRRRNSSLMTHRWRKPDSNRRSLSGIVADPSRWRGNRRRAPERPFLYGGTDGSNPVPSGGESGANLIFGGESHRSPSGISPTPTQRRFSASHSSMSTPVGAGLVVCRSIVIPVSDVPRFSRACTAIGRWPS